MSTPAVDLVINCYERTCRRVLEPGFVSGVAAANRFAFARKVVLINNVEAAGEVESRARERVAAGEIDAFHRVETELPRALARTGLSARDLGRIPHFSDWALVAVTLEGSPWLVHWDPDVELERPVDWIRPSLELMTSDDRIAVANPAWSVDGALEESVEGAGEFALSFGFSDQLFLARREELSAPIYHERCALSLRYPLAHIAHTFECRLDAYLRNRGRLRATFLEVTYRHCGQTGRCYPRATWIERWRRKWYRARVKRALEALTNQRSRSQGGDDTLRCVPPI